VLRKIMLLAAIVAVVLAAAAPALAGSRSPNNSGKGNSGNHKEFAGLVDIGGGRNMYLECHGKGSPTVVFVSGAGDRAETWSKTLDPSKQPVLPAIAETNRVCAYDRPGTIVAVGEGEEDFEKSRSDPVPQPTTLQDGVADLHAPLSASGERGPYVVVGHSMGGAISRLYMPLIVFSSDKPYDLTPFVDDGTLPADIAEEFGNILFQAIVDARPDLVSQVPGARHITDPESGHYIHQERPELVIDSVREVVAAVRKKAWCKKGGHNALGSKNQGQCIKSLNHARRWYD
jgi:hypothetical protein